MVRRFEWLWIALGSLMWFACLMPWGSFTDPDAFYHAHMARLMLTHGPLTTFPWLDLTAFGQQFADHHFLYHLLLIPGIWLVDFFHPGPFAEFWATQFASVALATTTIVVFWAVLKRLDPSRAWMWTVATLLVPSFSMRLLLGKASPIAIGLFIAGIGITACLNGLDLDHAKRKKILLLGITGLLFTLSHGGWIILLITIGAITVGDVLFRRLGEDTSWRSAIHQAPWYACVAITVGIVLGLLIHPNRATLFHFLWIQVVRIGIAPPTGVISGLEWLPFTPTMVIEDLAIPLIAVLAGIFLALEAGLQNVGTLGRRDQSSLETKAFANHFRRVVLFGFPVAVTLALTFKSGRFIEYLAPAFTLWVAALWCVIDPTSKREIIKKAMQRWPASLSGIAPTAIVIASAFLITHQAYITWTALHRDASRPFNAYRATLASITEQASPGDRVFHSDWDEFPTLLAANDSLRYISGLDPVFFHEANPELAAAVRDLTLGRVTSTAWQVIAEQTGSSYVFVTTKRHPFFDALLRADSRFAELSRNEDTATYRVIRP